MIALTKKELIEIEIAAKLAASKTQSDKIKDLDKSKAYDLLVKISNQYSLSEVISVTSKKQIG